MFEKKLPSDFCPVKFNFADVMTSDEWSMIWKEMMQIEDFWVHLSALSGARELHAFLAQNYDAQVYFITSRAHATAGQPVLQQTTQWLENHGLWPRLGKSVVIVTDAAEKYKYINALNIPYYFDDYGPTIAGMNTACEFTKSVLLDAPYNQESVDLRRVFSVTEFLKQVKEDYSGQTN